MQILIVCNSSFQNVLELPACKHSRAESFLFQLPEVTKRTETKKEEKSRSDREGGSDFEILGDAVSSFSFVA